ncbi:LacI family DNA-binding transcriptional regulator [Paracoccus lichenicola]|uniref:LacI family DNA-binding transcriptional regulator n=1 Tax=Paracoccus lichenicola TaxID=2665644 RepID=UPI002E250E56
MPADSVIKDAKHGSEDMANRPTIQDVAVRAGLSLITVDRALNGRKKVRPETLRRIMEAAQAIGYHGVPLVEARLRDDLPSLRVGVLLLEGPHPAFFRGLGAGIEAEMRGLADFNGSALLEFADWSDPQNVASRLRKLGQQVDAIAAMTIDHPAITAIVGELRDLGKPVYSLLSDFAPGVRESYIGLNNRQAGRAGAWFVSRVARRPGKVLAFVGSSRFHGHEMREIGFRSYLRERAPAFEVVDTVSHPGDEAATYRLTSDLLRRHEDLVAINLAGFGPEGVIHALRDSGRAGDVVLVCNEVTPESATALTEEIVTLIIETPKVLLCRELVALIKQYKRDGASRPGQAFLPFNLLMPESI